MCIRDRFKKMQTEKYKMTENAAAIIIPTLCEKTSIASIELKLQLISLIKKTCQISSPINTVNCIVEYLKSTRSKKVKLECLSLVKEIVNKYGANKGFPLSEIKSCLESLTSLDSSLKVLVLEILAEICKLRNTVAWESSNKQGSGKKVMQRNNLSSINITDPVSYTHLTLPTICSV
eukprot:TRINITY_DN19668_c0_g1_i1.p2 TRINITY_DN19668_c0_g1~~TRINITY_DN19668_c0_g1_i1.p2  ORF type:complete len:177 (+),score=54.85 TRINITY_DN19668_c0_g1_i1:76-606(+)